MKKKPPPAELNWAYFIDVDGTLIEIAETPGGVLVDAALVELIEQFSRACGGALALVSGRSIANLDGLIACPQLPMAGLHGLERRDAGGRRTTLATVFAAKEAIKMALVPVLERHPGLLLEDKGLTLALHYRSAPTLAAYVHRLMARLVHLGGDGLELQRGKRVVEIKPAGIDKGSAIDAYLAEPPFCARRPVFIGDDLNDEHGFAAVNRRDGISVKVGKGASCARFRLPDVQAVRRWLGSCIS